MPSIVIPAHDEAAGIGRLLHDLSPLQHEVSVVVVCNGCTDDTAAVARRSAPWAKVIELPEAGKTAALNAGDRAVSAFPRLYLDADARMDADAIRRLLAAVGPELPAAAATPCFDTTGSHPVVRSHYRFLAELTRGQNSLAGTGAMAVTATGRARFDTWPAVLGDDYYLDGRFGAGEKQRLPGVVVGHPASRRLRDCVSRRARIYAGNRALIDQGLRTPHAGGGSRGTIEVLRRRPGTVRDLPAHVLVTVAARALAAVRRRTGRAGGWYRDR